MEPTARFFANYASCVCVGLLLQLILSKIVLYLRCIIILLYISRCICISKPLLWNCYRAALSICFASFSPSVLYWRFRLNPFAKRWRRFVYKTIKNKNTSHTAIGPTTKRTGSSYLFLSLCLSLSLSVPKFDTSKKIDPRVQRTMWGLHVMFASH